MYAFKQRIIKQPFILNHIPLNRKESAYTWYPLTGISGFSIAKFWSVPAYYCTPTQFKKYEFFLLSAKHKIIIVHEYFQTFYNFTGKLYESTRPYSGGILGATTPPP